MPKLAHTKSTKGCVRCKSRKVKCDEVHPTCGACTRHQVVCDYPNTLIRSDNASISSHTTSFMTSPSHVPSPRNESLPNVEASNLRHVMTGRTPTDDRGHISISPHASPYSTAQSNAVSNHISPYTNAASTSPYSENRMLELKLLHHFTVSTSLSFSTATVDTWRQMAPRIALKHSFFMDAIMATAALHLSRTDETALEASAASNFYFNRAVAGQVEALATVDNASVAEALFGTTALITIYSLVLTSMDSGSDDSSLFQWLRIGNGGNIVTTACSHYLGGSEFIASLFRSEPDMTSANEDAIFAVSNRSDLQHLLDWGTDFETITDADREAYEKTLSFVGFTYQTVNMYKDKPLATGRCIIALPSRCPERFRILLEEKRPRALVIIAHQFAALKLLETEFWWSRGIAEQQVRLILGLIPAGWKTMMRFPLQCCGLAELAGDTG